MLEKTDDESSKKYLAELEGGFARPNSSNILRFCANEDSSCWSDINYTLGRCDVLLSTFGQWALTISADQAWSCVSLHSASADWPRDC